MSVARRVHRHTQDKIHRLCFPLFAAAAAAAAALVSCGGAASEPEDPDDVAVIASDPKIIELEGTADNSAMLAETQSDISIRLRISTRDVIDQKRPKVNLVLAIDTSGSMKGEPMEGARSAALRVVKELADGDRLAIVAFHSKGEVVVPSTPINALSRASIVARIAGMEARGTTSLQAGMALALAELQGHRDAEGVNRLILLSDGVPNNPASIDAMIGQAKSVSIPITALGFGLDYDESLLTRIARGTGGTFLFVEDPERVADVFVGEVLRLQKVVARNMVLSLTPGPGMSIVEVFGSEIGSNDRAASIALGDHSLGEVRDVIVRLRGTPRRQGTTVELLDSLLSFEDAVAGAGRLERAVFNEAAATADPAVVEAGRDRDVELSAARAAAAAATVNAISMARAGQLDAARALLVAAEKSAREAAARFDQDTRLVQLADAMLELDKILPSFVGQVLAPEPGAARATPAEARDAPATVRKRHREAIETLQGR